MAARAMAPFPFFTVFFLLLSRISADGCDDPIVAPPGVDPLSNPLAIPNNATEYMYAIMAGSGGACPIPVVPVNETISRIRYFIVNEYGVTARDSAGYQYASTSRSR